MRTKPVVLVLLVACAALSLLVGAARPVAAGTPVAKTATVQTSTYPWVQPVWQTVHGVVVVEALPSTIAMSGTQPPAWITAP